jgi:hypothetical protein
MNSWINILTLDPLKQLLSFDDQHLQYRIKRDLFESQITPPQTTKKEVIKILKKQQANGSWVYKNKSSITKYPSINHDLFETFKAIRLLVGKYELDNKNEQILKASEYILSCQTEEGDIRGILGNQYMPYYCGLLIELIIKAGYISDIRVNKALEWLTNFRQDDHGWVIPMQFAEGFNVFDDNFYADTPILPDKTKPSSHMTTGMVLRAFSSHQSFKKKDVALKAATLLKNRIFTHDKYNNRKKPEYWLKFEYPYWWTTLTSALDSLYEIGFTMEDKNIEKAVEWLLINQKDDGLWGNIPTKGNIQRYNLERAWISYDICRLLKLYLS